MVIPAIKTSEILIKAKALIPTPDKWWRGVYNDNDFNMNCPMIAIELVLSIHYQTINRLTYTNDYGEALRYYRNAINVPTRNHIGLWNDDPNTTFEMVHKGFDNAIVLARKDE